MKGWIKGQVSDREGLIKLLSREEWNQLHFSSSLYEKRTFRLVHNGSVYILKDRHPKQLKGAFYITRGGALHSCFEPSDLRREDLDYLEKHLQELNIFSFIGRSDRVKLIEELYHSCDCYGIDYDLMVKEISAAEARLGSGYTLRRVGLEDLELLYPLEEAYQREEVLRDPSRLDRRFLKRKFQSQLESQFIWAVFKGGRPVAKGGTNAIGFRYCQLGGVYTIPSERGRGLGRAIINRIGEELAKEKWGTSLFVRKDNRAALKLYQNCGYERKGDFRIVYPENN
ncbi:MAG: GNAT family N-acetyltransferase [Spirochaetales bacterium]|nr:GNAT family N-acetyltransferase [Spirochaetales bacterium]